MAGKRRFRSPELQSLYDRFVGDDPEWIASFERASAEEQSAMDVEKRKAIEAAGFRFGDAADFLDLTEEDRKDVEAAWAALAESDDRIPYDEVRRKLRLTDDGPSDPV